MKLELVIPEGNFISKECKSVSLPGTEGVIEVMVGHEAMIVQLNRGSILIDGDEEIEISAGFAVIDEKSCRILVDKVKK